MRFLALAASLGLAALPALAQETTSEPMQDAAQLDTNGDGAVSRSEFMKAFKPGPSFARWDVNEDGVISKAEFTIALYEAHDIDGDGAWTPEEMSAYDAALRREEQAQGAKSRPGAAAEGTATEGEAAD